MANRPHICHVIYRLDYGGLENGLVNLINRLPVEEWQHTIVCLAGFSDFRARLRPGVEVVECRKQPGQDFALYGRLWRLFRRLRPSILHTRNLATLEAQLAGWCAGVPVRIHGEHGHDVHDLDNQRARYRLLRKLFSSMVDRYVTVSRRLEAYLAKDVGIAAARITRICNGVDTIRFHPRSAPDDRLFAAAPFARTGRVIIGTVGRMQAVKDQLTLARAFVALLDANPHYRAQVALVMIGDGPLRVEVQKILAAADLMDCVWLPGSRDDVPALMREFDVFVLPSLGEGISNTVLEAMACGLPVLACDVGGNGELVVDGETGVLVPRAQPEAMAVALGQYVEDSLLREIHGQNGRRRVEEQFSLDGMVDAYATLYRRALTKQ
ncbi:MAG: TIGR03088 family PEP-CTERM/XrtA system glycosyltransferase [Gammaproteobacteria bacterium]|nr:TIGR03088 family PEP-CTERM/XrtA system glycosyltransferase [Gammaproteobacteria bacterium]